MVVGYRTRYRLNTVLRKSGPMYTMFVHVRARARTRTRASVRVRRRKTGEGARKPLNGVTSRQSHHLSIVWAKPSKSTANRFCCLPLVLLSSLRLFSRSCSLVRSSFAPLSHRGLAGQPPSGTYLREHCLC